MKNNQKQNLQEGQILIKSQKKKNNQVQEQNNNKK